MRSHCTIYTQCFIVQYACYTAFGSLYVSWPLAVEASSMYRVDVMGPFLEPSGLVPSQFAGLIENKKREV